MKKYKWGILGTGRIARTFSEAINGTENAQAYAVASRSEEKAGRFAAEYGFTKAYGSYEQLAADPDVDVVYIATPMSSHYDDVMMCLRRGKHVLCEKSAAINSKQLDDMIILAREKRLFFMEAMWMKCRPAYRKAKEWASSGRIGKITSVRADFCNEVKYDPDDRLFKPECGGGALLDLGVYAITLAADFLGYYPSDIVSSCHLSPCGTDMGDLITLIYGSNSTAQLTASFDFLCRNNAAVYGTEGSIRFGDRFFCTSSVQLLDTAGNVIEAIDLENEINGCEYEIKEVHSCLEAGICESRLIPHSETAAVMSIMDHCRRQWGLKYPEE